MAIVADKLVEDASEEITALKGNTDSKKHFNAGGVVPSTITGNLISAEPEVRPKLQPLDGVPDLAYLIADRVTNPYQAKDCIILITGRKRSGKSTQAVALAEEIAEDICTIKGDADPKKYFDVTENIISVERMGGLDILTSERATRTNQVFVLDDAKINISNRKFNSPVNQIQNELATIFGPFKHVLIFTSVFARSIDKDSRELADFIIKINESNPYTLQTLGQVFWYEIGENGYEYKKYLRWKDPSTGIIYRLKVWIGTLPSKETFDAYNRMRKNNSVKLIEEARQQAAEIKNKKTDINLKPSEIRRVWIENNKELVRHMRFDEHCSIRKIARDLNKPTTTIEKCLNKES